MLNNLNATPTDKFVIDLVDDFNNEIIQFQPMILEKAFDFEDRINKITKDQLIKELQNNCSDNVISIVDKTTSLNEVITRQIQKLKAIQMSKYTLGDEGLGLRTILDTTAEEMKDKSDSLQEEIQFFNGIISSTNKSGVSASNKANIKDHFDSLKGKANPRNFNRTFKKNEFKCLALLLKYFRESKTNKNVLSINLLDQARMPSKDTTVYILRAKFKKFSDEDVQVKGHNHTLNNLSFSSVDKIVDKYHGFGWKHTENKGFTFKTYGFPILKETTAEQLKVHVLKAAIEILLYFCSLHKIISTDRENTAINARVDIIKGSVNFIDGKVAIEPQGGVRFNESDEMDGKVCFHDPSFRDIVEGIVKPEFIESGEDFQKPIIVRMYEGGPCCYFKG